MTSFHDIARQAIADHTTPGDLVIDPMCGTGDTLITAVDAGCLAIGVEQERHWVEVARQRIVAATERRDAGFAAVVHGNPLDVAVLVGPDVRGRAALIVTSLQDAGELAPDFAAVAARCRQLLKPGGRLVVLGQPASRGSSAPKFDRHISDALCCTGYAECDTTEDRYLSFKSVDFDELMP